MEKEKFEVTDSWQRLLVEVGSIQTDLHHTIQHWTRYLACRDMLTVWLPEAEKHLANNDSVSYIYFSIISITI